MERFKTLQIREDWGLKGTVGMPGWKQVMQQYLKHEREEAAKKLGVQLQPVPDATLAHSDAKKGKDPAPCLANNRSFHQC